MSTLDPLPAGDEKDPTKPQHGTAAETANVRDAAPALNAAQRTAPADPLAVLNAMSEEEKIALFT